MIRRRDMAFATLCVAIALTLLACNGLIGLREPTEIDDSGSGDSGNTKVIKDAGTDSLVVTPGPPPTFPTLVEQPGAKTIATPTIVPVTFRDYPFVSYVNGLVASLGDAGYWDQTVKEYGVTAVNSGTPIMLDEAAPVAIEDLGIQQWLADKLTSDASPFGAPSPSTTFVIYYPAATTITAFDTILCKGIGSYHGSFALGATEIAYAVIPQCGNQDAVTMNATFSMLGALTDRSATLPDWFGIDDDHIAWEVGSPNIELTGLCGIATSSAFLQWLPAGANTVARAWSNAAARAGRDPCVPSLGPTVPYFNAAPIVPDTVTAYGKQTKGVKIPKGQSRTIAVSLFADAPLVDPWDVTAEEYDQTNGQGPSDLTLLLDRTSGNGGDVLYLTITVAAEAITHAQFIVFTSTQGTRKNFWYATVGN